jgi:hypothetical protein
VTKKQLEDVQNSITNCVTVIETTRDEYQEQFDGKTEEWQESPIGQALEARIEDLSEISSGLEDILTSLNTIIENFNGEKK